MAKLSLKKTDGAGAAPDKKPAVEAPDYGAAAVPGYRESARDRAAQKEQAGLTEGQGALFAAPDVIDRGPDYGYRRLRLHRKDEVDVYSAQRDRDHRMSSQGRICLGLAVLLVVVFLLAMALPPGVFAFSASETSLATWFASVQHRLGAFFSYVTFQGASYSIDYTANRYLIIALGGAALAVSGAVYQGALKNSLASPSTLGVMQGANAGRIVYVLFFYGSSYAGMNELVRASEIREYLSTLSVGEYLMTVYGDSLCCLVGSAVVVVFVLLVSHVSSQRGVSSIVMVITGQIVATLIGAVIAMLQYFFSETGDSRLEVIRSLQVEAFSDTFTMLDVVLAGIPVLLCLVLVLFLGQRLNILAFSEEEARSMGANTTALRWGMVGICTLLTAVVVAFCGNVGMVGFVVPHVVRRIVGPNFKYLLPASMLAGAVFLVAIYCALSMFGDGVATNIGVFTSLLGGVFFIIVALRQKGDARGAWL